MLRHVIHDAPAGDPKQYTKPHLWVIVSHRASD